MTQKVKQLAKELNYRPNPFAQSLRKEAPRVIGVIVPNLVTHYYAAVLDGIEDYASKLGYSVISANSHEDHEREAQALDNFLNMHVEGIIACLAQDTTDYSHFEQLHKMGVPLVFFARCCLEDKFSQVVGNGDVAAQEATQHMIETGSRRVAFIGGPNHLDMVRRRKHGYLEVIISLITLKYTQSNSVCYVKDGQAIGIGAGQQSRIHCTRLAGSKADEWWLRQCPKVMNLPFKEKIRRADRDNTINVYISDEWEDVLQDGVWEQFFTEKPEPLTREEKKAWIAQNKGVSLGSDAFFPFGDNIERAHKSGVEYIAEAGGSIRDDNVIDTCDKYGIAMAFTHVRLFHH